MLKTSYTNVHYLFTETDRIVMTLVSAVFWCILFVASTGRGICTEDTKALGTCVVLTSNTVSFAGKVEGMRVKAACS